MRIFIYLLVALVSLAVMSSIAQVKPKPPIPWAADFALQRPGARPKLEARYSGADRTGFIIEGQSYRIALNLSRTGGHRIRSFQVKTAQGPVEMLTAAGGEVLAAIAGEGISHRSSFGKTASRINVYRRGPYFIEVHWLDVALADEKGVPLPALGEVTFFAQPHKVHVEIAMRPQQELTAKRLALRLPFRHPLLAGATNRLVASGAGLAGLAMISSDHWLKGDTESPAGELAWAPDPKLLITDKWPKGERIAVYGELLPMPEGLRSREMLIAEINPLRVSRFRSGAGRVRYDERRGVYTVGTNNPGGFAYHHKNPNAYERAFLQVENDERPRVLLMCHETSEGSKGQVEAGILLDAEGQPLPIQVQTSKNFSGENEEPLYDPGDPAFSETYFPLVLAPKEKRSFTSLHLYQNWGSHPIKQVSSLRAWMDYLHMSAGVTETTCLSPFKFGGLSGISIPDLRPMSQPFWSSQPQHDNVAGHRFAHWKERGKVIHMEYLGTSWISAGPNWAALEKTFLAEDGKAELKLQIHEMPQTDETRCFVRLSWKAQAPIHLDDARDLSLISIGSQTQGLKQTRMAWVGESGGVTESAIPLDNQVHSSALLPTAGWAAVFGDPKGGNAFLVQRWSARIGGMDGASGPGLSVTGATNGDTTLALTLNSSGPIDLKPGDEIIAEVMLLPFGPTLRQSGDKPWAIPAAESTDYGTQAPRVLSASQGVHLSDAPITLQANSKGVAEWTQRGGRGSLAVRVEGLSTYKNLTLSRRMPTGAWQAIPQGQKGEGVQTTVDASGNFGAVFVLKESSKDPIRLRVAPAAPPKPVRKPARG